MKARIKSKEDFPHEELCCPTTTHEIEKWYGVKLTLIGQPVEITNGNCSCGLSPKGVMGYKTLEYPQYLFPVNTLDIEEGS